jgi:putative glutamine amidotransferase
MTQGLQTIDHDKPFEDARSHIHDVEIDNDSKLYSLIGQKTTINVNSIHHQGIDLLGEDLRVTATSPDGVIEGIETTNRVGCNWYSMAS